MNKIAFRYRRLIRSFIAVAIAVNWLILATWTFPGANRFLNPVRHVAEGYVGAFGLWQWWHMLARPGERNYEYWADVFWPDGTKHEWSFPTMHRLGIWERFRHDRFEKWEERIYPGNEPVLGDACLYVARIEALESGRYPSRVEIYRRIAAIPNPLRGPFYLRSERYPFTETEHLTGCQPRSEDYSSL